MQFDGADLALLGTLILLEGLLSADNALVMAVIGLGLPEPSAEGQARVWPLSSLGNDRQG